MYWNPLGTCSSLHSVTTVVMGNCGFTLAPSRAAERHLIVRNLERAEDISGTAMAEGNRWKWETFPVYLDALDSLTRGINYAANLRHSALRTFVNCDEAFERESTEDEIRVMEHTVREALEAGANSIATSTASKLALGTAASTCAMTRSPPACRSRVCRNCCSAGGRSANGAPFRSAPGFRCTSGM